MNILKSTFCLLYLWAEKDKYNGFGSENSAAGGLMILLLVNTFSIFLILEATSLIEVVSVQVTEFHFATLCLVAFFILYRFFTKNKRYEKLIIEYKEKKVLEKRKGLAFVIMTSVLYFSISLMLF